MEEAKPSHTALRVAMRRAAHQLVDEPKVLDDPIALKILGPQEQQRLEGGEGMGSDRVSRGLRAFMAARSRYAEDELARAISRGVTQYAVLGAGLDTFAYRNPHAEANLRIFEVDYPATQEWKRRRLAASEIPIPPSVTFAPVDFERQTLATGLRDAGFDREKPAFFSWLGVSMYLTEEAIEATLGFAGSLRPGGGIVFDYVVPRESLGLLERTAFDALSRRVEAAGEPFRTSFDPSALAARLQQIGFRSIEDLSGDEINARYFKDRSDGLRVMGNVGRLICATR
ncbi:MAG TPA: class I SAM-dependent methyltransferase [Candidatus Acidoferrales bacterium]|jgi:methyltransferase (TIGR00027 family)|nr:class I SAM-dependent methyltransferase [Candidatus Acidoferrales bacterium]